MIQNKKLWCIFPVLSFFSWVIFAGMMTNVLPQLFDFLFPLVVIFYLGALLFTVPLNIFTLVIILVGRSVQMKDNGDCKFYYVLGFINFFISIVWITSMVGFRWIIAC